MNVEAFAARGDELSTPANRGRHARPDFFFNSADHEWIRDDLKDVRILVPVLLPLSVAALHQAWYLRSDSDAVHVSELSP